MSNSSKCDCVCGRPSNQLFLLLASLICGSSIAHAQPTSSANTLSTAADLLNSIIHDCPGGLLGGADGGTVQIKGGTDGGTVQIKGGTDGGTVQIKGGTDSTKRTRAARVKSTTSSTHSDLGISNVLATKSGVDYSLSYCIVNRGGKPAHAPATVQVRAKDVVLSQQTYFETIGSRESLCPAGVRNVEFTVPSLEGTTIAVTAAANEYSTRDNICRVKW